MNLAQYIEHTNLDETTTKADIIKLCKEALQYGFYGVCVYPRWISKAKQVVDNKCKVITVISFPEGNKTTEIKVNDAKEAIKLGADELDMVINKTKLKTGADTYVRDDIKAVVAVAGKIPVKVIIEMREMNNEQKKRAVKLVMEAGAKYVKTSTGKSKKGGATVKDIKLIKSIVGNKLGIKAAGEIRDRDKAEAMINAGATRIGASKSIDIIMAHKYDECHYQELKYSWEWFKYHAGQRYNAFYYYFLLIGALIWLYFQNNALVTPCIRWLISLLGIIATLLFYLLEKRNEELVNYGRNGLEKMETFLEINIRNADKNRSELKTILPSGWLNCLYFKSLCSHAFVSRVFFVLVSNLFMWLMPFHEVINISKYLCIDLKVLLSGLSFPLAVYCLHRIHKDNS